MDNSRFRQRLIGAAVLVVLAVIFLPMILSGEDDPRNDTSQDGAQDAGMKTLVMRLDSRHRVSSVSLLGDEPPPVAAAQAEALPLPSPVAPPDQDGLAADVAPAPAADVAQGVTATASPVPTPASVTATVGDAATEEPQRAWVIQSGSFTNEQNAKQLLGEMQHKGFASILLKQEKDGVTHYKIRLGPYDDEAEARKMADQVRGAGFNSRVVRIKRWKR